MTRPPWLYRAIARTAVPLVPLLLRDDRQQAAHQARLAAPDRLAAWAKGHRDRSRLLAWFHAPSVGEGLQAQAVIEALRAVRPSLQVLYTHYSPSAESFAASLQVDHVGYLPYDQPDAMRIVLDALEPNLLVFTKLDLWPELATAAAARSIPVAMIAATVTADSGRLGWPARLATRTGYTALRAVGAIATEDAARLRRLGVAADRIHVTGDPRVDSVCAVVDGVAPDDPLLHLADPAVTLVAGSTWPRDEAILLEAFVRVRSTHPNARLFIVPHEPTEPHLRDLDAYAARLQLPAPVRLGALAKDDRPAIVVADRTGVLARLYANGLLSYVGGGWGDVGIHSVLEPAAWGRPVIIGPRDRGSRDAALLRESGGLTSLPTEGAVKALDLLWSARLADPAATAALGATNRAALEGERGAAKRNAKLLDQLLG